MYPPQITYTANGNIRPRRFVTTVTGNGNAQKCVEATLSTAIIIGVSFNGTRYVPGSPADDGYLAIAGEQCSIHGPGHIADLDLGANVTNAGALLTTDGSGLGTPTPAVTDGTVTYYGALAAQTGLSGETIKVIVLAPTPTA